MANWLQDLWTDYHKTGILPNLWKGFTGQLSAEVQSEEALAEQQELYEKENQWQREKYAADMDFANRQLDWQMSTAQQNFDLQKQQFQYQKDLNNLQMQREDNAMQRQVADLQAAGFSPLAAIGGSGSAAGSLNAGTAPQMDTTGVGTAAGQYLDLARQYASLHQDLSSKNADARLGAKMALSQMKADLHFKGQNMATQYFNAAVNARNKNLQNESMAEDIKTKKYQNDWYAKHGYSHVTLATVLSDFLNRDDTQNAFSQFGSMIAGGLNSLAESIKEIKNGSTTVYHELGKGASAVIKFLSNDKSGNFSFSKEENNELYNDLSKSDRDKALEWCKKNNRDIDSLTLWDWMKLADETQ